METLIGRCCGLDVHQATVVACLRTALPGRKITREIRSFATTTAGLLELRDWLTAAGCTDVAMESTGVYWRPVHALLEDAFTVIVGNAQRIKNVPGRKTDVKDAEWLAELVALGLIPPSFVPDRGLRVLRDLVRFRRSLVEARTDCRNRTVKLLESANIKLAGVATDVFGVSGMAMLAAIVAGQMTPAEIADLAKGRLRKKLAALELALTGSVTDDHRLMLDLLLGSLADTEGRIAKIEKHIDARLEPYRQDHRNLTTIPGVDWAGAASIIAELGTDMTVFGTPSRASAWGGVAPGNNESGGRRRRAGARKGNVHLKTTLHTAAVAAGRTKATYLADKYHRIRARGGPGVAAGAVAHKILIAAFHILARKVTYRELGADYLDRRSQQRIQRSLVHRLERLGYDVALRPKAA
jgi:transposase